jgi:SH3 domain-containing YSC84-like protein 1
MKKLLSCMVMLSLLGFTALIAPQPTRADDKSKWLDRIENSGMVMKEIMDVPDDIPQNLIDKAECVIVFPSVLKAAFGVGASYGRGIMTCRSGDEFKGPVDDGSRRRQHRISNWGASHRFRSIGDERPRRELDSF